jgi:hypothetical protein
MSHDGSHITDSDTCFEWWYFDFDINNRYHVYIEWHAPNFTLYGQKCMLVVRCYKYPIIRDLGSKKVGEQLFFKSFIYPRSAVRMSQTHCHILFPSGSIIESDGNYKLILNEKNVKLKINLKNLAKPTLYKNTERIYTAESGTKFFSWYIPLPKAEVSGSLKINDEKIEVSGYGYHDHNWGNLILKRHFKNWKWLRVLFDKYVLIFGDICERKKEQRMKFLILIDEHGNTIDSSETAIETNYSAIWRDKNKYNNHAKSAISFNIMQKEIAKIDIVIDSILNAQEFAYNDYNLKKINNVFAGLFYLIGQKNSIPKLLKKVLGICIYTQYNILARFYLNDKSVEQKYGVLEHIDFDKY